jgi:glycosyltransferase involved in cell wall biosynthesis
MQDELILCLSPNHLRGMPVSKHHIMRILSRRNTVVFVEPPLDVFSVIARRERWHKFRAIWEDRENFHVISPVLPVKSDRRSWLVCASRRYASALVSRLLKRLERSPSVIWAFEPLSVHLIERLEVGSSLVVYHVTDEYASLPGANPELVEECETRMLERADLVFAVSSFLAGRRSEVHRDIRVLPNAVDAEGFQRNLAGRPMDTEEFIEFLNGSEPKVPEALRALKRPILGFTGTLSYFVDTRLIRRVAEAFPEASVVLIGPAHGNREVMELGTIPNVHLIGRIPHSEIPGHIRAFDVCLLPLLVNEVTADASPLTLFEYLLCGKPVVSTMYPLSEERTLDFVHWARSEDEFIQSVRSALTRPRENVERRVRYALENGWEARVGQLEAIVDPKLDETPPPSPLKATHRKPGDPGSRPP